MVIGNVAHQLLIPTPAKKAVWHKRTVKSILANEKYKGAALLQKRYTVDFLQKKMKVNEGEVPQYYVEDSHPAITWHSTDKYRRLIWQCIDKFHNEVKCTTTHLTEPQIKEKFLEMFAIYFADRKATLDTLRYVQKTLTDTDFIDEDIADSEREMDLLTEMIRQTVMQNASASVTEEEYHRRYNDLTDRFRAEEEKHKRLTERRKRMVAESVAIGGMLSELTELEAPPIEFDEKLWHAVVDRVTVYNDDRLVYSLKDGTEITVML